MEEGKEDVKTLKSKLNKYLREELNKLTGSNGTIKQRFEEVLGSQGEGEVAFCFTSEPKSSITTFIIDKCMIFLSKKVPLKIVGENKENPDEPISIMFKFGDDLRQDNLCLQLIALQDKIWLRQNLDLCMTPYKVVEIGLKSGYLEFVENTESIANIQKTKGDFKGAFNDDSILDYIKERWTEENWTNA
jgi:phosphatidylinositol kinase/protein kinase (PI-3  family)